MRTGTSPRPRRATTLHAALPPPQPHTWTHVDMPWPWGSLGPAVTPQPPGPLSRGAPMGRALQPWGTTAGTAGAVGGHESSVAAQAAASAHGCQHNARPRLTAPFVSPLGRHGRTKQSAPSAPRPGARPGGPCGDIRRGGTHPDRPGGAQRAPGGPLLRAGCCPDGEAGVCGGPSPRWNGDRWDWCHRWDRCDMEPCGCTAGAPADCTTTSQQIWVREGEGQNLLCSARMPKWGVGGGMLL